MQVSLGRRWAPHRGIQLNPPPQVKLGCGRAESHQQNPRFKTHDLKILKDTYKPGGVTPLPPPTPRIPLGRPLWTTISAHFGSKKAGHLFGRGPWALIGPCRKFKGGPWALLGAKPSLFYLPGMPPRALNAKTGIIKIHWVL